MVLPADIPAAAERSYKALSLQERLDLALRLELSDVERALILHREQWMQIRVYFARRLDLRSHEISILLDDADHVIRLCIAKRHDLTPKQVAQCVNDRDANVRYFIGRSPLLSEAQCAQLAADEDPIVRRAVAKGPRSLQTRQRPGQAELVR